MFVLRNDFIFGIEQLLKYRTFDYIFLECSGIANPGPIAQLFWIDSEELESKIYLDAILTLVDAKFFYHHYINNGPEAVKITNMKYIHILEIAMSACQIITCMRGFRCCCSFIRLLVYSAF